ncbi:MAG: hypothetical protein AAB459_01465 [Patescibacteria group bacterium]
MKLLKSNLKNVDAPDRAAEIASDAAWKNHHPEIMKGVGLKNENREANQRKYNFVHLPAPASETDSKIIPGRTLGDVAAEQKSEKAWEMLDSDTDGRASEVQDISETLGGLAIGDPLTEEVQVLPDGSEKFLYHIRKIFS